MNEPTQPGRHWWKGDDRAPECLRVFWGRNPHDGQTRLRTVLYGGAQPVLIDVRDVGGHWGELIPDSDVLTALMVATLGHTHPSAAAEKWRFMAMELHRMHPSTEHADMCYAMSEAAAMLPQESGSRGDALEARKATWGKCPHCRAPAWRSCKHDEPGRDAYFWCLHCNQKWTPQEPSP